MNGHTEKGRSGGELVGAESRGVFWMCELWDVEQTSTYLELGKRLSLQVYIQASTARIVLGPRDWVAFLRE